MITETLVIFMLLLLHNVVSQEIECFADGECTESLFIGKWPAEDAQECLETCQEHSGCQYFTYYGLDQNMCLGLVDCVVLDDKTCEDCYSGSSDCPDLQCWVPGSCVGHTISADNVSDEDECLSLCKNEDSCEWITYNELDNACVLLTECSGLGVSDCNTCWSSQVQCGERKDLMRVLIVGGYIENSASYLDNVEALDLSSQSLTCESVSNYPFEFGWGVGTVLEGLPTVCGGYNRNSNVATNECYQYDYEENRWIFMDQLMLENRWIHKASMIDSATWLITGGQDNDYGSKPLDSTEFWQNGEFQPGPLLPFPLQEHCQVTLNSSFVAILGGYNRTSYVTDFNLYNLDLEEWTSMPDIPVPIGLDPCGLIENSINGIELVVLDTYDICYIFNFGDMSWREGPKLPYDEQYGYDAMVVQMDKTFYIIGGLLLDGTVTDAIFKFDNENYTWHLENARLQTARRGGVAIAVPDEIIDCF